MPYRVAVVEDDVRMRSTIVSGLREEGLLVPLAVGTGGAFLAAVDRAAVDVAVLDVALPDCDGRDVCLAMRARGMDVPVLFLTARDAVVDRLLGFHAGADDYLPKPFAFAELVVRLTALGRRHVRTTQVEGAVLDPATHTVRVQDGENSRGVALTPTEFRLLSVLMSRRGEVVRRRAMIAAAWPDGAIVQDNTLDAYVARVRRKLRDVGAEIAVDTAHGVGYRID